MDTQQRIRERKDPRSPTRTVKSHTFNGEGGHITTYSDTCRHKPAYQEYLIDRSTWAKRVNNCFHWQSSISFPQESIQLEYSFDETIRFRAMTHHPYETSALANILQNSDTYDPNNAFDEHQGASVFISDNESGENPYVGLRVPWEKLFSLLDLPDLYPYLEAERFLQREVPWENYQKEAYHEIRPSLNSGDLSVVNFLLELKDLKNVTSLFKGNRAPKAYRRMLRETKRYKGSTAQTLASLGAGIALTWSFAVAPFISDVRSIVDKLLNWKKNYEKLFGWAGKPVSRHRSLDMGIVDRQFGRQYPMRHYLGYDLQYEVVTEIAPFEKQLYTATTYYRYLLPELTPLLKGLFGFLDTLGVGADPSIVWNAIPFSFVVDWVYGVSNWLHDHRLDAITAQCTLDDFCESVRYPVTRTSLLATNDPLPYGESWYLSNGQTIIARERMELYGRLRSRPIQWKEQDVPKVGKVSFREVILGSALAHELTLRQSARSFRIRS